MDSASTLLFGIPELIALVASSLDRHDLSRLMRTNRFIHTHCAPWFYKDIDVRVRPSSRQRYDVAGLQALARNAHLVRGIRMDDTFFDSYYECLAAAAALEEMQIDDEASLGGKGIGVGAEGAEEESGLGGAGGKGTGIGETHILPSATPAASAISLTDVVFPRMTKLTRFEYNLPAPGVDWSMETPIRDTDSAGLVFGKFSLMMPPYQYPHLVNLTLNGLMFKYQRDVHDVARAIAGMTSLQTLRLGIDYADDLRDDYIPRIFFSLPPSIQVFTMRSEGVVQKEEMEVVTPTEESVCRRDEPLLKLREWDVSADLRMDNLKPFFLMFPYCPELELVMVPAMINQDDEEKLANFIVSQCPKLRRLSRIDLGFCDDDDLFEADYGNYDGVLLSLVDQAMARNTLEAFYYDEFYERQELNRSRLPGLLSRHSQSLREVHLRNTHGLCGYSVTQLLHLSPILESLVIVGVETKYAQFTFGVELQRLSNVSWASSRLRELRLEVDLGYLSSTRLSYHCVPFSLPSEHVQLTAMEFGAFIANIGKQKDLRVLDLRVALPRFYRHKDGRPWSFQDEAFPGLLSLSNRAAEDGQVQGGPWRGFLEMLGGLSKLEELRGSVNLNPQDAYGYTTGQEEAEWMRVHWPKLRVAEFYPVVEKYTPPPVADEFARLQKQLPDLIYSDDFSV